MKKGYFKFELLLLFVYISLNHQFTMARHTHHHRTQNSGECYRCPPGYGMERHCNHRHDTECGACAPDHYSSHFSSSRPCYPCSRCGTGLYVAHKCTATNDTVCDSCHTYRGPHNEDFYDRCVAPLLDTEKHDSDLRSQDEQAKEAESIVEVAISPGVSPSEFIAVGAFIGALAVILMAFGYFSNRWKHDRRVDHRYPYVAVATKEAVML